MRNTKIGQEFTAKELIDWGFRAFISVVVGVGIPVFSDMVKSIDSLNNNIATLIERDHGQRRAIERHEKKLDSIEKSGWRREDHASFSAALESRLSTLESRIDLMSQKVDKIR